MPLFHITFSLDLAPFREAPYFSAKCYLDPNTITDPLLKNAHQAKSHLHRAEWDDFVSVLSNLIIMQTKNEFEKHTAAAGLTNDERKIAWDELSRSAAFFGVTSTFSLHEAVKNSLEAEAEFIHFHICTDENRVACIVNDNGTGFTDKKFRALFSYKDETLAEPLLDYRMDIMANSRRFQSPKRQFGTQVEEKTYAGYSPERRAPRPRNMQILKPIDERMTAYGISVGGEGRGLSMTLQAIELGGGFVHLTNMDRLADISVLADIRPNIPASDVGSVIIFSSPPMTAAAFETLQANREEHEDHAEIRYFLNLDHDRMTRPGINQAPFFEHPEAVRVRVMDGSVHPLSQSDLPIIAQKHSPTTSLASRPAESKRISLRRRHASPFFDDSESKEVFPSSTPAAGTRHSSPGLSLSPLILDMDSEDDPDIVAEEMSPKTISGPGGRRW